MTWKEIYEGVILGTSEDNQRALLVEFSYRVHASLMTDYGWLALEETFANVDDARAVVEQIFKKE